MRILIVNYAYFELGGPERYLFNIESLLRSQNHEVIPFSIQFSKNKPSPFAHYFAPPIGTTDSWSYSEIPRQPAALARMVGRSFYSFEVKHAIRRLIDDTQPDVAYVMHYLKKLSPSIIVALKESHIPIVVRLSDFLMLCPQAHMLRSGTICELCESGRLHHSIFHRCVKNSLLASCIFYFSTRLHKFMGLFNYIDRFVCPSRFLQAKMIGAGWPAEKTVHINTPYVCDQALVASPVSGRYFLYCGKIGPMKGVDVLVKAYKIFTDRCPSPVNLVIAGRSEDGELERIKHTVANLNLKRVLFLESQEKQTVLSLMQGAIATVVPSVWFENLPNVLIESLSVGTPVIASNLGSLPESITDGQNGCLFPPKDVTQLSQCLLFLATDEHSRNLMGKKAKQSAEILFSPEQHLRKLISLFEEVIARAQNKSSLAQK